MKIRLNDTKFGNVNCRRVVKRTYRELRQRGVEETAAFDSAATVYRILHPEVPRREARFTIAEWLD